MTMEIDPETNVLIARDPKTGMIGPNTLFLMALRQEKLRRERVWWHRAARWLLARIPRLPRRDNIFRLNPDIDDEIPF